MTNPTPHGQVPEALIDLIDAYAETRHRCGGIYNARTEAARKAVIEALSGVQALSAARAGFVPVAAFDRLHAHAESLAARLLAASPTPPAEQQARWVERWHGSDGKEFWEGWSILNAANREMIAHLGPDVDPDAVRGIVAAHNEALCGECAGTGGRWCPACAGATPPAEQQAAPKAAQEEMDKEASNARLDIDSNSTEPEQQRDVACSLEVGQHVGNGEHKGASCRGSEDSELLKIAARNLKYFIEHAQFSSFADKRAALNCLDALGAPPAEQAATKAAPGDALGLR